MWAEAIKKKEKKRKKKAQFSELAALSQKKKVFLPLTRWGFVERQPCARNDCLALGRTHMGLISPHFSFILSWQNNGCLWRVSYPLLSLSPHPNCLSLRRATLPGLVRGDTLKFHVGHIGLWLHPTRAPSPVCHLVFSSRLLSLRTTLK